MHGLGKPCPGLVIAAAVTEPPRPVLVLTIRCAVSHKRPEGQACATFVGQFVCSSVCVFKRSWRIKS
eukprot:6467996-Amphidinium_carterae.1